jgi:hypothetical protein
MGLTCQRIPVVAHGTIVDIHARVARSYDAPQTIITSAIMLANVPAQKHV